MTFEREERVAFARIITDLIEAEDASRIVKWFFFNLVESYRQQAYALRAEKKNPEKPWKNLFKNVFRMFLWVFPSSAKRTYCLVFAFSTKLKKNYFLFRAKRTYQELLLF